ncbi:flagellar hook-associated protein 3 [Spirochaetia bacterium 38H-sp]|uniref:Flagellar hook-associated protein 3 n=1 Tax=Rarispira pelagica TaxID=3141764 RepID=A0ABU9UD19_9SPIR
MQRISTNMPNDDMIYHLQQRELSLYNTQNKMATQKRIQNLRDDPTGAAHAARYDSLVKRLEKYAKNIEYSQDYYKVAEDNLRAGVDILHRIRELTVQAAHGTYTKEDLQAMGKEVDQLLQELTQIANTRGPDGSFMFGGARTDGEPFRIIQGNVPGADGLVTTQVQYIGDITERQTEIADGELIATGFVGSKVFAGENQHIYSTTDAMDYRVTQDGAFYIDGTRIEVTQGDTIYSIVHKINNSDAAVKASIDPVNNSLILNTTTPHQMWLEDEQGSTVLQDLGVITSPDFQRPPDNIAASAIKGGGNLFDSVIRVRDMMMEGNTEALGGKGLASIDNALGSMIGVVSDIGAKGSRLEIAYAANQKKIPDITEMYSKQVDLDISKAMIELKQLETTHKAALSTAARILPPTLLDFLR